MSDNLKVFRTPREAASACAAFIADALRKHVSEKGRATFAISGGSTPRPMFQDLAKESLDWSKIHLFWVDERCVPPTDDQSNYKLALETLVDAASIPTTNIHRIKGELRPEKAVDCYVAKIKEVFGLADSELPAFDVLHRGMGPDAHTASLFPGEPLIGNNEGIAEHVWVEKMKMDRVTLLPGVLRKAALTVLQVAGIDKAEPLVQVLRGPDDPFQIPCQIATRHSDRAVWFLDEAAASKL